MPQVSADDKRLPAIAWVRRDAAMSFELVSVGFLHHEGFVEWVYRHLGATVKITNLDHRRATVWWLDGHSAKPQGVVSKGGGVFERASFVSHRWYCWAETTEGTVLTPGASLGEITLNLIGEVHELTISPKCVDSNGHCAQWRHQGECERNAGYMANACSSSCAGISPEWPPSMNHRSQGGARPASTSAECSCTVFNVLPRWKSRRPG